MQSKKRVSIIIIMATIILSVACQRQQTNTVVPVPSANAQNTAGEESPELLSDQDQERFEGISKVLNMIESGKSALQQIEAYQIGVRFEPGGGSRFFPSRNEIVLDSRFGKFTAALILVHEATHARYYHEGLAADIKLLNRQAYTQMKTEEEMAAAINSIAATKELWESGLKVANLHQALYYPYQQAYGSAVRSAKSEYPGMDEISLQNIGHAAGRETVRWAFLNGQVVTSITQQSYLEYWGSVWDQINEV
jgi:hypothetical protein